MDGGSAISRPAQPGLSSAPSSPASLKGWGLPETPQRPVAARIVGGRADARSHGIARFNFRDAHINGRNRRARSGRVQREDLLDFETHGAVAFARCRREPRSVDLDPASLIRPDRSGGAQIAHQESHRRSSHTEYLRQRLLGEREYVVVDAVAKLEQPASHPGFDRVQRIAGRAELELYQHLSDVILDQVPDRRTPD